MKEIKMLSVAKTDIQNKIYTIRGIQVMLDSDLAVLYGIQTKVFNQSVRRNKDRFPKDFCLHLTKEEYRLLRSQIVTSNLISQIAISKGKGGRQYRPFVFTEQGVAMLSGVLKSKIAVQISIRIMSEFVAMRKVIQTNSIIYSRLERLEQKQITTDKKFDQIFDALSDPNMVPKQKIFFDGQAFDAHKFVSDIIRSANSEIVLIDNFVDDTVLSLFIKRKENIKVTIYIKNISRELINDLSKFNSQYSPIEIKEFDLSHDRFLIIDHNFIYHFGASLKDLGKKWFAVSRFDNQAIKLLQKL
ncbi:MAG: ORF6N domain-containing protein [Candidatus Shapirobacteria bacterium]